MLSVMEKYHQENISHKNISGYITVGKINSGYQIYRKDKNPNNETNIGLFEHGDSRACPQKCEE
jgi:hypothetical protein